MSACCTKNCKNKRHPLWHLCAECLAKWAACAQICIESGINPVTGEVSECKPEKPMRPKGSGPSDHKEMPYAEQVMVEMLARHAGA